MDDTSQIGLKRRRSSAKRAWAQRMGKRYRPILCERFPNTFMPKGTVKKPLKIGIDKDLCEACPDINPDHLKGAIRDYTSGPKYLMALTFGAARLDLTGAPAGVVSVDQAAWASAVLQRAYPNFKGAA